MQPIACLAEGIPTSPPVVVLILVFSFFVCKLCVDHRPRSVSIVLWHLCEQDLWILGHVKEFIVVSSAMAFVEQAIIDLCSIEDL